MNKNVTPERVMQFAWSYAPTLIIEAAVHHGIFDLLDESPRTIAELSKETGASRRGLTAILNVLVGINFLTRKGERYSLTPESAAFLVSSRPGYLGALFKHMSSQLIPNWLQLTRIVQKGKPAATVNDKKAGAAFFAEFVEALFPLSYRTAGIMGEHLKVPGSKKPISVLDIAAGSGVWGIALAEQSPHVRICAVDWPEVLKVTKKVAKRRGVAERMTTIPGDILKVDYGTGHDVATLGHILHSEGAERSRQLLRKVFRALEPGGTIVIAEFVPNDERTGPPNALIFAVNMLVSTKAGDTFTFAEISKWLREAGLCQGASIGCGRSVTAHTCNETLVPHQNN